jgi:hypothetical protein
VDGQNLLVLGNEGGLQVRQLPLLQALFAEIVRTSSSTSVVAA